MLTSRELCKFNHHILLNEIGIEGQLKLKNAKVLCVGAGGLGTPVCLYLASAGIGTIGIIDGDQIALSNLPRQILYTEKDIGKYKSIVCKNKLTRVNPDSKVTAYQKYLTDRNAIDIIDDYDIIIDCSDNFATRYLANDICHKLDKINVFACIHKFNGLCTVFHGKTGPCYRCLFETISDDAQPNCADSGILNTVAGIVGLMQVHETVKMILGMESSLKGEVLIINTLTMTFRKIKLQINPSCVLCSSDKRPGEISKSRFYKTNYSAVRTNTIPYNQFLEMLF